VDTPLRLAFVCTGNICRSPMAEVAVAHLVARDDRVRGRIEVTSAGTARWHVGSPMDPRARAALDRAGFTDPGTLAAYADGRYLDAQDLVVVMTREHRDDVLARVTFGAPRVVILRNLLQPGLDLDLADPYYGSDADFDACLATITAAGRRLTAGLPRLPDVDGSSA
jgi:protein-tyrosine phosphatase